MKKILAVFLAVVLALSAFAACGNKAAEETTPPNAGDASVQNPEVAGTLTLYAGAALKIAYGADGLVLELTALNDSGEELLTYHDGDVYGVSCTDMVKSLVVDSILKSYMYETNYVVIKQNKGSALPGTSFLESVQTAAQRGLDSVESKAAIVLIAEENLNAEGYIDLVTAELLVRKFLGVDKLDLFDGTINPVDGMYAFEVSYGLINDRVVVDAATGAVAQGVIEEIEQAADQEEMATTETEEVVDEEDDLEIEIPEGTVAEEA